MPKKKKRTLCYLCGELCDPTNDHIFPRCLFPDPAPTNLLTAPACQNCNYSLHNDEELFRNFVASGVADQFPSGKSIWDSHIIPSLDKNRSGITSLVRKLTQVRPFYSADGKYLGPGLTFEPTPERIDRVLNKIAKGLYYLEHQEPMPQDVDFQCVSGIETPMKLTEEPWGELFPGGAPKVLGDYVVAYWRSKAHDNPSATATWMIFYQCNPLLVVTCPKEILMSITGQASTDFVS